MSIFLSLFLTCLKVFLKFNSNFHMPDIVSIKKFLPMNELNDKNLINKSELQNCCSLLYFINYLIFKYLIMKYFITSVVFNVWTLKQQIRQIKRNIFSNHQFKSTCFKHYIIKLIQYGCCNTIEKIFYKYVNELNLKLAIFYLINLFQKCDTIKNRYLNLASCLTV